MVKTKLCAAPKCDSAASQNPRRYIHVPLKSGKTRRLHVCRPCHDRHRANGSFKRYQDTGPGKPNRWAEEEAAIVAMRKRGRGIAEIVQAFPGLPRRTAYSICARHGLAGTVCYEVGQGGRRTAG